MLLLLLLGLVTMSRGCHSEKKTQTSCRPLLTQVAQTAQQRWLAWCRQTGAKTRVAPLATSCLVSPACCCVMAGGSTPQTRHLR